MSAIETLITEFADASIKADEFTFTDGKAARRYSEKQVRCWKRIRKIGNEAKEVMARLFDHPDPSARVAAAGCLLRYKTDEALAVLRDAAQHEGLVPFMARECLKRWEEGEWHLDE